MKLYHKYASWWHVLSSPEEYKEEATLYWNLIKQYKSNVRTTLELGSGGGNNAFYLKKHVEMTLVDKSAEMLAASKKINPTCPHHEGDMRTAKLHQQFDLVFIHDAIGYMTTEQDLAQVFQNAYQHLNPQGMLLLVPDDFQETFAPETYHGGNDTPQGSVRYLEWVTDQDPQDNLVEVEYLYIMKDAQGKVETAHDSAIYGLFAKQTWQDLLQKAGFEVHFEPIEHTEVETNERFAIVALKKS
ncbi:MAG TPA: class I SAM-dependent methyltransferase [Microscillaceae bacterium]|nr:class I SAM-dependent methyltransferase [Microscillaceae bacterium]